MSPRLARSRKQGLPARPKGAVAVALDPSELAEPEVFAMMLLALCLIGYRVRRDSSEKFK